MHILFDARTATPRFYAISRYTAALANALAKLFKESGDKLTIVRHPNCTFDIPETENVMVTTCIAPPDDPKGQLPMKRLAEQLKPDIYHTPHRMCPTIGYDCPIVITIHDFSPVRCRSEKTPQESIAFMASMSTALKTCTKAMTVSKNTLNDAKAIFPQFADKCVAIPHGVSEMFKRVEDEDILNRVAAGYGYSRKSILYLGSTMPHKNIPKLLKGYAKALPLLDGAELVLAGHNCNKTPHLTELINSLGIADNVKWIGGIHDSDLTAVMSSVRAFISPSLYEGFGLSVLEAMAVGAPVACSEAPALKELTNGAAVYFDTNSPDSISQAIVNIMLDEKLRDQLKTDGIKRASEYSWDKVAQATVELYKAALKQ